jgi:hypothetical protein
MFPTGWVLPAAVLVLAACSTALPPAAQEPIAANAVPAVCTAATEAERVRMWQADIDSFAQLYRQNFAGAFAIYPAADFDRDIAALRSSIPADAECLYALKAIAAKTQCGHAAAEAQRGALVERRMPYQLRWFADGLFIVATDEQHAALQGAQVLRIGGKPVEDALRAAAAITPSESETWTRLRAPDQLCKAAALKFMGLCESDGSTKLGVRDRAGAAQELAVQPMAEGKWPTLPAMRMDDPRAPFTWAPRAEWYGNRWLDSDKTVLYVWYDKCSDQEGKSVAQFAQETLELIDTSRPRRIIVDLRRNTGGNSALLNPFIQGIAQRSAINRPDTVAVLMGGATFSSGAMNAEQFRRDTKATLVGEAIGARPLSWMEVASISLPNSLVRVNYMNRAPRWNPSTPRTFEPDIPVTPVSSDFFRYGDPVLERAQQIPYAQATP